VTLHLLVDGNIKRAVKDKSVMTSQLVSSPDAVVSNDAEQKTSWDTI
jgi:hypothetical protein